MSDASSRRKGNGIIIVSVMAMFLGVVICFAILSPGFALAILALLGLCVLQYLLWGWWLSLLLSRRTEGTSGEVPSPRNDA